MVTIISLLSIARRGYFGSLPLLNYRRNYSFSSENTRCIEYMGPVSLMVIGIIDFDTHGRPILDLVVVIENCNK